MRTGAASGGLKLQCIAIATFSSVFIQYTALSSGDEDGHQMYSGGSVEVKLH